MTETQFQTMFTRWVKNCIKVTAVFELKITKGSSIPFDAVKPHQVIALINAKRKEIFYKIPDTGMDQKPFDCFNIVRSQAFVVVMFYRRGQKDFYMINIDDWQSERETSDRKSLTEERANQIGIKYTLK